MKNKYPKGNSKLLNAWAFYDWANSVYSLVIASAIFPIFYDIIFKQRNNQFINIWGVDVKDTAFISFVTAFALLVVFVISPILSGIADFVGNKKFFLRFFCYLGGGSCIGLYWFSLDHLFLSFGFYFFGLIGFWASLVFYNSYLPDIAFKDQQDKVSAKGFSMGYIGSTLLLVLNLSMVMFPDVFGISGSKDEASITAMRYSFIMVGVWWIGFSHITYYYLPKGNKNQDKLTKDIFFNGLKELHQVWKNVQNMEILKKYLLSYFIFIMAVQTVMLVATYFGATEVNWETDSQKTSGLIISILLIQIVAVFGATLTSILSSKIGNISSLITLNIFFAILCLGAFYVTEPIHFYIIAGFVGLVMGGIQSMARSTYSKLIPDTEDTTTFFSFYDASEKLGIVIGMSIYGYIDHLTGSMRNAIVFLGIFFVLGAITLMRIPRNAVPK
jgi:UMF1 family MFS transporter